jgi:mitotic spindle assembly checkpoint protein MAD2B
VEKISLVVLSSLDTPLEKFVWDVSSLPTIPPGDLDSPCFPLILAILIYSIVNAVIQKQVLEDSLRAAMIRTAFSDANLSPLPEDCTFTLTIEMRDERIRPGNVYVSPIALQLTYKETTSPWMPAEQQPEPGQKNISIGGSTVPIRSVDVGPVRFEMWAEESRAKGKLPEKGD